MSHPALDPSFHELIDEFAPVRQIGTGFIFTEGPIWHPLEQRLLFSDMPGDVRRSWDNHGIREVMRPSRKGNGMTYDADLNLLVCEHATSSVARFRPDGRREVLASHFQGQELNSPNDLCVKSDGSIWFTDPTYGRMPGFGIERPVALGFQGLYRIAPGAVGAEPHLLSDRYLFTQPNGLCFSPDERLLYVNDTVQTNIRVFEVGADGALNNGRVFASGITDPLRPGVPDGMKCDQAGNVWVTAPGGLWVYAPTGKLIGKVTLPEMAANLHWGGPDWRTLFICATHSVYAVETKIGPRPEPFMATRAKPAGTAVPARPNRLEPSRCALILQDLQNDVMMDGGAFAETGAPEHARQQNVIGNASRLAARCREKGVLVIHVWFVCEPGYPAMLSSAPLFEGLVGAQALVRGTWGAAPAPGLEPQTGDVVVEKMTMSAWESGRLESYLRGAGRDTIINCGAWTNMSVEHTARTGADKGYRMVLPQDCCSTMNADWHRASVDYAMQNVATVTDCEGVLAMLD
ncbi:MAG: isochorismatase family protein [Pseudomonadota bacterium]